MSSIYYDGKEVEVWLDIALGEPVLAIRTREQNEGFVDYEDFEDFILAIQKACNRAREIVIEQRT